MLFSRYTPCTICELLRIPAGGATVVLGTLGVQLGLLALLELQRVLDRIAIDRDERLRLVRSHKLRLLLRRRLVTRVRLMPIRVLQVLEALNTHIRQTPSSLPP